MASLEDIRPKIAAAITAAIDAQCTGYVVASPTAPFFDVELHPDGISPHESFGNGLSKFLLLIRGCVSGLDISQQQDLDEWTATSGATSVQALLEADQTLGGVAQAVQVVNVAGYRGVQAAGQPGNAYLGAEWSVEVYTQG